MRYSGDTRGPLDLTQTARLVIGVRPAALEGRFGQRGGVKGTAQAQEAQRITGNTVDLRATSTSHGSVTTSC